MSSYEIYVCLAMCPKCGHARNQEEHGMICRFCSTRMISVDYPADKYYVADPKGPIQDMLIKKHILRNPQYSQTAYENRKRKEHDEFIEKLNQHKQAASAIYTPTLTTCPVCQGKLSTAATACPHCGQPMNQGKPVQAVQQTPAQPKREENVPRCPTCSSTNIRKLDVIDRGLSFAVWGIFSSKIGKSMMCKDCGYKW